MKHKQKRAKSFPILLLILGLSAGFLTYTIWQHVRQTPKPKTLFPSLEVVLQLFDFDQRDALKQWEQKVFHGKVNYWIDFDQKNGFVHSESEQTSSAIFYRIKFDISEYPHIAWEWRVGKFPDRQSVTDPKKADNYAARVYVVFLSHFFTNYRCVEYVWDEFLPEGTIRQSPFSDRIKQLVIQSGRPDADQWAAERRNVFEDYKQLFGEPPRLKVGAIALMTNSDGKGSEAEGFFDDIQIGRTMIENTSLVKPQTEKP